MEALYDAALETGYEVSVYQTTNPDELFAVAYADYLRHRYRIGVVEELDASGITAALFQIIEELCS